ncbi:MAG: ATP synthase F0 subunit B [Gemmataceae bacterium]|nr:ATP synthase F0 subunit B [Gemmataceae bacterium]
MHYLRLSLAVLFLATGFGVASSDPKSGGDEKGHAHGPPPKYEVTGHGADGKLSTRVYDLANEKDKAEFHHMIEEGHAHEVVNKSAPTIGKMASLRFDLGIWSLAIFLALMFVLGRVAWPKMIAGLQNREKNIRSALDEAEKARVEARTLMADLERERAEAAGKVKAMIDEGKRDAIATAEQIKADNMAQIAEERERLRREIKLETDQAMQSLWTKAADLATKASAIAIRREVDGAQHRRLIDEAIEEIRKVNA